jgi:erythritol transport system ATP-binding protein
MSDHSVVLKAEAVTKAFPGTLALNAVDFTVYANAVNVLIGENGAGKSTLMKILAGVESPTQGHLVMDGEPVHFSSIRDAAAHGIGIVFQELNLCPNLSVTENIFLGRDLTRGGFHIDREAQSARASELLARLEHDIDPDAIVGDLMIGEQQIVEIAKALAEDARILIMDEPTSALSSAEVEVLDLQERRAAAAR